MARQGFTQIPKEELLKVVTKAGLAMVHRKGFIKCYRADENGGPTGKKAIGIPQTDHVTRIELVNFEHPLGVKHPKPPAGSVTQMVDFTQDAKTIKRMLWKIIREGILEMAPSEEQGVQAAEQAAQEVGEVHEGPPEGTAEEEQELEDQGDGEEQQQAASH